MRFNDKLEKALVKNHSMSLWVKKLLIEKEKKKEEESRTEKWYYVQFIKFLKTLQHFLALFFVTVNELFNIFSVNKRK